MLRGIFFTNTIVLLSLLLASFPLFPQAMELDKETGLYTQDYINYYPDKNKEWDLEGGHTLSLFITKHERTGFRRPQKPENFLVISLKKEGGITKKGISLVGKSLNYAESVTDRSSVISLHQTEEGGGLGSFVGKKDLAYVLLSLVSQRGQLAIMHENSLPIDINEKYRDSIRKIAKAYLKMEVYRN